MINAETQISQAEAALSPRVAFEIVMAMPPSWRPYLEASITMLMRNEDARKLIWC